MGVDLIVVRGKIGFDERCINFSSVCGFCVNEVVEVFFRDEVKEFFCK